MKMQHHLFINIKRKCLVENLYLYLPATFPIKLNHPQINDAKGARLAGTS
jgi:hypothetical protein